MKKSDSSSFRLRESAQRLTNIWEKARAGLNDTPCCQATAERIRKALNANWNEDVKFALVFISLRDIHEQECLLAREGLLDFVEPAVITHAMAAE